MILLDIDTIFHWSFGTSVAAAFILTMALLKFGEYQIRKGK